MSLRLALFVALLGWMTGCAHSRGLAQTPCAHPWVFFDLGNTLIDTATDANAIRFMPGAAEMLRELKARGLRIGLISNIPPEWGSTTAERYARLKKDVEERWSRDSAHSKIDWALFDEEGILLPASVAERKPALTLFFQALQIARQDEACASCLVPYQGEDLPEIEAARVAGMEAFLIRNPRTARSISEVYYPIEDLETLCR